ncbi:hypothetical protein LTR66_017214, partial [Elasticomyces elasticus]
MALPVVLGAGTYFKYGLGLVISILGIMQVVEHKAELMAIMPFTQSLTPSEVFYSATQAVYSKVQQVLPIHTVTVTLLSPTETAAIPLATPYAAPDEQYSPAESDTSYEHWSKDE